MENLLLLGLPLPAVIILLVEILKKVGIVSTGDQARIANIVLSGLGAVAVSLLAEFSVAVPQFVIVVAAALYSIAVAALGYEGGEAVVRRITG